MAYGWNPVFVNTVLDSIFSAGSWTPPAASYIQLHTDDPGADGTANVSSYATRTPVTWDSAASGSKSITTAVTITSAWADTSPETITYVSYWDSSSGGTFIVSDELTAAQTVVTGNPVVLASLTAPWSPLAA